MTTEKQILKEYNELVKSLPTVNNFGGYKFYEAGRLKSIDREKELEEALREMAAKYWKNCDGGSEDAVLYAKAKALTSPKPESTPPASETAEEFDLFLTILTSVGVELVAFKQRTNKITDEDDEHLTREITNRIVRKLEEGKAQPQSPSSIYQDKDLIIQGLEEGSKQWETEYRDCRELLQDICNLQKVELEKPAGLMPGVSLQLINCYDRARRFLEKYQHQ